MTCVTRSAAGSLLALALAVGAAGCDSGDDLGSKDDDAPSDHGTDTPEVPTVTTLQNVGKDLDLDHRTRVKDGVTAVIDPWFEGAFLGDFPREGLSLIHI